MGPSDPLLGDSAPFVTETTPGGLIYRKDVHGRRNLPLPTMAAEPHVPEAPPPLEPLAAETLPVQDLHADIAQAFAGGDNARVVALAASLPGDERAAVLGVRAAANLGDMARAATLADAAAKAHPASAEIAFLHAIVLMNLGRLGEAETVLRRLVYLDHNLAVAHFALGNLRLRMGDPATARRAFTAVHKIAAARPPGEILALSEGETAGSLAAAASALAARLAGGAPASSVRRASR
jgi:tetratricopeptide (TPR) repeat protein